MSHRVVRDSVAWAMPIARPDCIPKSRPRGAKAQGLRYERSLAAALPAGLHGQWFEFRDGAGRHFCQPDLLLRGEAHRTLVVECKYTWVLEAHTQLAQLYLPVVGRAWGCRPLGLVICKNLTPEVPRRFLAASLAEALAMAETGVTPIFQWLGGVLALPPQFSALALAPLTPARAAA